MPQLPAQESTTVFIVPASEIRKAITERIAKHRGEVTICLTNVATMLKDKSSGDVNQLAEQAAGAMLALTSGENLTADSLSIKTHLERAAYLSKEQLELACVAKNLSNVNYKVSLKEAIRYGLV